jgi:hypothetical protein
VTNQIAVDRDTMQSASLYRFTSPYASELNSWRSKKVFATVSLFKSIVRLAGEPLMCCGHRLPLSHLDRQACSCLQRLVRNCGGGVHDDIFTPINRPVLKILCKRIAYKSCARRHTPLPRKYQRAELGQRHARCDMKSVTCPKIVYPLL